MSAQQTSNNQFGNGEAFDFIEHNIGALIPNPVEDALDKNQIAVEGNLQTSKEFSASIIPGSDTLANQITIQTTQTVTVKKNMVVNMEDLQNASSSFAKFLEGFNVPK